MTAPNLRPSPFPAADCDIERLRADFGRAKFDEATICALFGISAASALAEVPAPVLTARLAGSSALQLLARLFLVGLDVRREELDRAFGGEAVDRWTKAGLVETKGASLRPAVRFVACDGLLLAFDAMDELRPEGRALDDRVMGPSKSANLVARAMPKSPCDATLDLGTGCGYLALLAARHARRVVASDITDRSLAFTRFNAKLNGFGNVEVVKSDRFAAFEERSFDRIISNPPFAITPQQGAVFMTGADSADRFCASIARAAPRYLREGGCFQMICDWIEREDEPWEDYVRTWLQGPQTSLVLRYRTTDVASYAKAWSGVGATSDADETRRLEEGIAYLERHGAYSIGSGSSR